MRAEGFQIGQRFCRVVHQSVVLVLFRGVVCGQVSVVGRTAGQSGLQTSIGDWLRSALDVVTVPIRVERVSDKLAVQSDLPRQDRLICDNARKDDRAIN